MASGTAYGVAENVANADTRTRNERFRPSMTLIRIDLFGGVRDPPRRCLPDILEYRGSLPTGILAARITGALSHRSGTSCSGHRRLSGQSPSSTHCPPESRRAPREPFRGGGTTRHDVARSIAGP